MTDQRLRAIPQVSMVLDDHDPSVPEIIRGTGHLPEMRVDPIGLFHRVRAECGDVGRFRLADRDVVLVTGAGGSIGMAEVARATDGVTFGIATLSTHGVNPAVFKKLPYDAINDFVGVTEIVKAPGVLVINPKLIPVKTFAEFVAYLKANPGKVSYATPGNGTIGHMWGAQFLKSTGTEMHHIPYRGSAPAINDVLGNQVPVYFDQVNSSLPHIKSGKVRALAVSWHERLDVLPDVQTYAQAGHPDLNEPSWFGLVAPKNTPAAQVERVQKAIIAALKDPAVKQRMAAQGLYPSGTSSADFTKQIASEVAKMKGVAAAAGISID